jgi:toxin ParE1/3/4
MAHIYKQSLAEQDLVNVWLYTLERWGERQADKYLDDLEQAMLLLAETPLACRERDELTPAVRIHHHKHHMIVYETVQDGINVVRVLHESMDVDFQLED